MSARIFPCTYCPDNPLASEAEARAGKVCDHVLLRGVEGKVRAERLLDEPVELVVDGQTVTSAYSDHYGVGASIE